jgi:hypothetical protein
MNLSYDDKEKMMNMIFSKWTTPAGYRSSFKGVPMDSYETIKQFIDFTKYYVMFRGPRMNPSDGSTRKRNAHSFDVYQRPSYEVIGIRLEREAFLRGVQWANNRKH